MKKLVLVAGFVCIVPAVWAHRTGADPGLTGAPGEATCTSCHGGGSSAARVQVSASDGDTYTPGQKKTITVSFVNGTATRYGFQLSARLVTGNTQAGDFSASPTGTAVICAPTGGTKPAGQPCANNNVQYVGHTAPSTSNTFAIEWTAPAAASGDVRFYVAGNAANNNNAETGDTISTATLTLTPSAGGGNLPAITDGGVVTAFSPRAGVVSGGWIEIYGSNLSATTKEWAGGDFNGNNAPTSLDGVSVTINNRPAFVRFISPGQINVQAPTDTATGPVEVVVTNSAGRSPARTVTKSAALPTVLAPFTANSKTYIYAALPDGTLVGPTGLAQGANFRPARAGDTITMYGVGFGAARAAGASSDIPAGTIVTQQNSLVNSVTIRVGSVQIPAANILYQGLAPNLIGLYQFNVTLPANLTSGDQAITLETNGQNTGQTMVLTVQ